METAFFVLSNLCLLSSAAMLSDIGFGKQSRWLRLLCVMVLFPVEISLIELSAGLAGHLTAFSVTLAAAFVFLFSGILWLSVSGTNIMHRLSVRNIAVVLLLIAAGVGVGICWGQYGTQGTQFCHDDLTYHATSAAHWYLAKNISAGPMNYHYYVPMSAELLGLWFILPFGQDGTAFLCGYYWLGVTIVAAGVLFLHFNINLRWLGLFALCVCCSKDIFFQVFTTFSAVDVAGPAMILSAITFLACMHTDTAAKRWPYILMAGLSSGFAFGTKVPFVTVFIFLCIWIIIVSSERLKVRLGYAILFGMAAVMTGAFWYIRNLFLAGNPVFPGQLGPILGPLSREIQYQTSIVGYLVRSGFNLQIIKTMLIAHVSWPYGIFLVSFAGIAAGIYRILKPTGHRKTIVLILATVLVMTATYPFMPFSAANNSPDSPLIINLRFVIGPFLLGLLLFFMVLETKNPYRILWLMLCGAGIAICWIRHSNSAMLPMMITAILWYWIYPFLYHRKVTVSSFHLCMLLSSILLGLAVVRPTLQKKADENLFTCRLFNSEITKAWRKIDILPVGSKIQAAGSLGYCYYPFLGRHYQNQYLALTPGYPSFVRLHVQWREHPEECMFWKNSSLSREAWLRNFVSAGGEYLLIFSVEEGKWPEVHAVISQLQIAEAFDSGDCWVLWKIRR